MARWMMKALNFTANEVCPAADHRCTYIHTCRYACVHMHLDGSPHYHDPWLYCQRGTIFCLSAACTVCVHTQCMWQKCSREGGVHVCVYVWGGGGPWGSSSSRATRGSIAKEVCPPADHRCTDIHIHVNICVHTHLNGVLDDVIQSPKDPLIKVNCLGGCCASLFG